MSATEKSEFIEKSQQEVLDKFELGFWTGYRDYKEPYPNFFFSKKLFMLKSFERGYMVGRETAWIEEHNHISRAEMDYTFLAESDKMHLGL